MENFLKKIWYGSGLWGWLLLPFTLLYQFIIALRKVYLIHFNQKKFPVPIIIVGNICMGGVGKTPLVIALVHHFQQKGWSVGVVSRGYKARVGTFPHEVTLEDTAIQVGDEPLLIKKTCGCPVFIAPKRTDAVTHLLEKYPTQLIISDDGLQHYALGRSIEIVVIDGIKKLGNRFCLPAGPLREPVNRLKTTDLLVINSGDASHLEDEIKPEKQFIGLPVYNMNLQTTAIIHLKSGKQISQAGLPPVLAAVAGIGQPQRFFNTLETLGILFKPYAFTDHHAFTLQDFNFPEQAVIMTEKDAVKCKVFAQDQWYFVRVNAILDEAFWQALWGCLHLKGCC